MSTQQQEAARAVRVAAEKAADLLGRAKHAVQFVEGEINGIAIAQTQQTGATLLHDPARDHAARELSKSGQVREHCQKLDDAWKAAADAVVAAGQALRALGGPAQGERAVRYADDRLTDLAEKLRKFRDAMHEEADRPQAFVSAGWVPRGMAEAVEQLRIASEGVELQTGSGDGIRSKNASDQSHANNEQEAEPEQYVTMDTAAALVNKSKRQIRRYFDYMELPEPDVQGVDGRAHEWRWIRIRPELERLTGRTLPRRIPDRTHW